MFYYSRDRGGVHVEAHLAGWSGLLQADAYSGYNKLYAADRTPGLILEAGRWAHACRPLFALADIEASAAERPTARSQRRSRLWHWRSCSAWIDCSRSSAASTAKAPLSVVLIDRS